MKRRHLTDGQGYGGTMFHETVVRVAEQVQADDRMRLLEPTSLPKELRGFKRRAPPNTALLTRIAFEAFKARMWADGHNLTNDEAEKQFRGGM